MSKAEDREKQVSLEDFQRIPGVGKSISQDLWDLGYRQVADLKSQDPQAMYDAFCKMQGAKIDRCLLYVFRCAVYFASAAHHDPEKLKWWNWKDGKTD